MKSVNYGPLVGVGIPSICLALTSSINDAGRHLAIEEITSINNHIYTL